MTTLKLDTLSLISLPISSVVFYFYLNYTIASILCSASAVASSYYDWLVLTSNPPALWKSAARNFFTAILYLFVVIVYPPHLFKWYTGLTLALVCMVKVAEFMAPTGKSTLHVSAALRSLGPLFLLFYSVEISPNPDSRLDIEVFSWLRAIAIFAYILAWIYFVITATLAVTVWYDKDSPEASGSGSDTSSDQSDAALLILERHDASVI